MGLEAVLAGAVRVTGAREAGAALGGLGGQIQRMGAVSVSAASKMGGVGKALAGVSRVASSTGATLSKYVSAPLALAGGIALKMALDFDDAFTKIAALSNAGAGQIAKWKSAVLSLAGDTAKAPKELADALYFLASAGLKSSQIMPALTAAAKGSAVGLGEVADVAKITAQAMNAYAKSGLTAADVTDTLVAAVKAGTADPKEFATALGRILPVAAKAKVSFQEVTASLAALSNIGLDVNEGVTAMRGVLLSLEAPGSQAAKTLKEIGISTDEMRAAIADKGLLGALQLLKDRTGGNLDVMRKIIPNVRALTGALGLTGENAETVAGIFDQVTHSTGSMNDAFSTTEKGPMFAFRQALAKLQAAAIQMGEKLIPIATKVAQFVTKMADGFSHLSPAMQGSIIKFGAIALVAGPVLRIFGGIAGGLSRLGGAFGGAGRKKDTFIRNLGGLKGAAVKAGEAATGAGAGVEAVGTAAAVAAPALVALAGVAAGAAAVFVAWKLRGLDPANLAMAQSTANSVGVIKGVDGQRHAVTGVIKTWQTYHAWQAKNVIGNNTMIEGLGMSAHALRLFNGWMVNATVLTGAQGRKIAVLTANLQHYHGSLTDLQKAQIQHALHVGDMATAERILNGAINRAKRANDLANHSMTNTQSAAEGAANKLRLAGAAAASAGKQAEGAAGKVSNLAHQIANLRDRDIYIRTHYQYIGTPPPGGNQSGRYSQAQGSVHRLARGAVTRAASGLIARSPTMIEMGEGRYSTPFGRGAEAFIPLDSRGIGILSKALEMAIAKGGGGRGSEKRDVMVVPVVFSDEFDRRAVRAVQGRVDFRMAH